MLTLEANGGIKCLQDTAFNRQRETIDSAKLDWSHCTSTKPNKLHAHNSMQQHIFSFYLLDIEIYLAITSKPTNNKIKNKCCQSIKKKITD